LYPGQEFIYKCLAHVSTVLWNTTATITNINAYLFNVLQQFWIANASLSSLSACVQNMSSTLWPNGNSFPQHSKLVSTFGYSITCIINISTPLNGVTLSKFVILERYAHTQLNNIRWNFGLTGFICGSRALTLTALGAITAPHFNINTNTS